MIIKRGKKPFDYWVIDNFFGPELMTEILYAFKRVCVTRDDWWEYDNAFEKKMAFDKFGEMPPALQEAFQILNSTQIITLLEELTGVSGLVPDPHFRGGGLHRIQPGGHLAIHSDFNIHPVLKLKRKLNLLVYLNEKWEPEWNGALEFWDHCMNERVAEVQPIFNRAVLFDTSTGNHHGHPDPIAGPKERWSLATYYYVANLENEIPHSTLYKRRPTDLIDPEVERLRVLRGRGRQNLELASSHTQTSQSDTPHTSLEAEDHEGIRSMGDPDK